MLLSLSNMRLVRHSSINIRQNVPGLRSLLTLPLHLGLMHQRAHLTDSRIQDSLKRYARHFPADKSTVSHIETYSALRRDVSRPNNVIVGIIYENDKIRETSKLVQTLLADPLAGNSEAWYRKIENRAKEENTTFTSVNQDISALPNLVSRDTHIAVASPILDAEQRPKFAEVFPSADSKSNSLQIVEFSSLEDAGRAADACAFYVHVTSDLYSTNRLEFPKQIKQKIFLTIVDNPEYTPRSVETTAVSFLQDAKHQNFSHHVIKVNTEVLASGIDAFYKYDTKAASQYFESVQASNILEVSKFLLWYSRTENVRDWIFHLIKTEIASGGLSETEITANYEDLRTSTLASGSQKMHAELQTEFVPRTEAFFSKKLRWYMLYFRNDNVEYAVKDFMSSNFMPKSIDSYNYLKGQVVAKLQVQKSRNVPETDTTPTELENPLLEYKANLINNRASTEIQLVVYSLLTTAFGWYQLPLSAISLVGYVWVGLDVQSAVAIAALGWTMGFNHVLKSWHRFTEDWLKKLFDDVRLVVSRDCVENGLLEELNVRYEEAKKSALIRQQILAELDATKGEVQRQL